MKKKKKKQKLFSFSHKMNNEDGYDTQDVSDEEEKEVPTSSTLEWYHAPYIPPTNNFEHLLSLAASRSSYQYEKSSVTKEQKTSEPVVTKEQPTSEPVVTKEQTTSEAIVTKEKIQVIPEKILEPPQQVKQLKTEVKKRPVFHFRKKLHMIKQLALVHDNTNLMQRIALFGYVWNTTFKTHPKEASLGLEAATVLLLCLKTIDNQCPKVSMVEIKEEKHETTVDVPICTSEEILKHIWASLVILLLLVIFPGVLFFSK